MMELTPVSQVEPEIPKRKRGRPRKSKVTAVTNPTLGIFCGLPNAPTSSPVTPTSEMQHSYQVLKTIMKLPKVRPFLERPDKNLFGLHNYHKIVKKPMWLSEVSRKFMDHEYNTITEFLNDITLMLKNCYKFWGPYHKFTKLGFRIEAAVQQHAKILPEYLQPAIPEEYKVEQEIVFEENSSDSPKKEFISKIMLELEKEINEGGEVEQEEVKEEEMWKWEKEIFGSKLYREWINTVFLIPEIGQFLKLSYQILDIDEITQFEIERMLLMPKESHTLATVMTTMLCPYAVRGNLFLKPVMCYEVWSELLKKKVDHWYNIYYKIVDLNEVFEACGVEPHFWLSMGEVNPLCESQFHELPLFHRAWLLKALCTYTFHSNKRVEALFNSLHEESLRPYVLWEEGNHEYFTMFAPEIRVYRQRKVIGAPELTPSDPEDQPIGVDGIKLSAFEDAKHLGNFAYTPPSCMLPKQRDFYIIASNCESLDNLVSSLKKRKSVSEYLQSYDKDKHKEITLIGLKSIYSQWFEYRDRLQCMVNYSFDYWITKRIAPIEMNEPYEYPVIPEYEIPEPTVQQAPVQPVPAQNPLTGDQPIILGKRVHKKRVLSGDEASLSDQNEGGTSDKSDVSDWEEGNIRRKPLKRKMSKTMGRAGRHPRMSEILHYTPPPAATPYVFESRVTNTGVTILKMKVEENTAKKSIVSAAVGRARGDMDEGSLAGAGDVLTISIKGSGSEEPSPPPSIPPRHCLPDNLMPCLKPVCVEGRLSLGQRQDGSFGYRLTLPDGGNLMLSNEEVMSIRARNGGAFPEKVTIPLLKYA